MKINKVLKFSAAWCGPCKVLKKTLDEMESVKPLLEEVDIEENEDLCLKYNIRNVPVLVFLDENDNEIERLVGNLPKNKIEETINNIEKKEA